jgi:MinD-like ATPase involved in chromosome partitioning or flagellar assembly
MNGTVVTFYSYKGGVGRSMALANIAVILARWGARVLCVDWDLEAPGLQEFFAGMRATGTGRGGLLHLLESVDSSDATIPWEEAVESIGASVVGTTGGRLDLIPAGNLRSSPVRQDDEDADPSAVEHDEGSALPDEYTRAVQAIDWNDLFGRQRFGEALEATRHAWKREYDFVLVDSRTGLTDVGGICAIHLPDIVVALTTLNSQSLRGAAAVARSAEVGRSRLPFDRSRLLVLPVLSRVDARVERKLASEWHERAAHILGPICLPWCHRSVSPSELLRALRIPYVPSLSYGEKLVVLEESTKDSESAAFVYETLAALLARGLDGTDELMSGRDRYVYAASVRIADARAAAEPSGLFDVFITSDQSDRDLARGIANALKQEGLKVAIDLGGIELSESWAQSLQEKIAKSRNLLTIVGQRAASGPDLATKLFLETAYETSTAPTTGGASQVRRIVPFVRKGVNEKSLGFLGQFQAFREGEPIEDLVKALSVNEPTAG